MVSIEEKKQRELEEKAVQACVDRYMRHGSINRMRTAVEEYLQFMASLVYTISSYFC